MRKLCNIFKDPDFQSRPFFEKISILIQKYESVSQTFLSLLLTTITIAINSKKDLGISFLFQYNSNIYGILISSFISLLGFVLAAYAIVINILKNIQLYTSDNEAKANFHSSWKSALKVLLICTILTLFGFFDINQICGSWYFYVYIYLLVFFIILSFIKLYACIKLFDLLIKLDE